MTSQELTDAAQAYAKAVEARTDLTLSTKNTYLVHVNRFVKWYSNGRSWMDPFELRPGRPIGKAWRDPS